MTLVAGVRRVIETRSGRYTAAVIPLLHSPLPGFDATAIQAVRLDDPSRAVRLVLYARTAPRPGPAGLPRAA